MTSEKICSNKLVEHSGLAVSKGMCNACRSYSLRHDGKPRPRHLIMAHLSRTVPLHLLGRPEEEKILIELATLDLENLKDLENLQKRAKIFLKEY